MKIKLQKVKVYSRYYPATGYRQSSIESQIYINGRMFLIDKELRSANNPNPSHKDLELLVKHRGLPSEVLKASNHIIHWFNNIATEVGKPNRNGQTTEIEI